MREHDSQHGGNIILALVGGQEERRAALMESATLERVWGGESRRSQQAKHHIGIIMHLYGWRSARSKKIAEKIVLAFFCVTLPLAHGEPPHFFFFNLPAFLNALSDCTTNCAPNALEILAHSFLIDL